MNCEWCQQKIDPKETIYRVFKGYGLKRVGKCCFEGHFNDPYRQWLETRKCEACGRSIVSQKGRKLPTIFLCGYDCSSLYYAKKAREDRAWRRGTLKCALCGKEFTPKRIATRYCSI